MPNDSVGHLRTTAMMLNGDSRLDTAASALNPGGMWACAKRPSGLLDSDHDAIVMCTFC